jgi:hypothetical protein
VSQPIDIVVLGIENPLGDLTVSPNPAKSSLTLNREINANTVIFTDLTGRTALLPISKKTIDVTGFSRGLYLLTVKSGVNAKVIKVILN